MAPRSRLRAGDVVSDRYEVRRLLGHGAMGTVYQVYDRALDETVALKMLGERAGSEAAQRFRSEIKLARKVAHPNVCRIYEYGEDGPRRFISMEFVDGRTIKERLRREGPLPICEACDVVGQAAEALQAIHEAGIIHRDLKTLNLMQDAQGRVRVMDFGIAKPRQAEDTCASEGYTLGTPEYMSPEQARGLPLDHRSDVYSLGIVLFELLTGNVPFHGDSPTDILARQMHEPALEVPGAALLPAALLPVLRRVLAKDPDARYGSARELAGALRDLAGAAPSPVVAMPVAGITVTLPPSGRRGAARLEPWLGVAAVLVIVAGLAHLAGRGLRDRPDGPSRAAAPSVPAQVTSAGRPQVHVIGSAAAPADKSPRAKSPDVEAQAVRFDAALMVAPVGVTRGGEAPSGVPTSDLAPLLETAEPPEGASRVEPAGRDDVPPAFAETKGRLKLGIRPWAYVYLDGAYKGTAPMGPFDLAPGVYTALLKHPAYGRVQRKVTIRAGQTTPLNVDLSQMGTRE